MRDCTCGGSLICRYSRSYRFFKRALRAFKEAVFREKSQDFLIITGKETKWINPHFVEVREDHNILPQYQKEAESLNLKADVDFLFGVKPGDYLHGPIVLNSKNVGEYIERAVKKLRERRIASEVIKMDSVNVRVDAS